jgi:hypothetical protein
VAQIETKVGLAAIVIATAGPMAAEVSMLAVGGIVGGVVAVAVDQRPMNPWRSALSVLTGVGVALVLGGAVSHVVPQLDWVQGYGLTPDILWAPVGFALSAFWRPSVETVRRIINGWRIGGPK